MTNKIEVLDPSAEPNADWKQLAPRVDKLDGKVIGFLSNNKPNARPLLENLERLLTAKYKLAGVVWEDRNKDGQKSQVAQHLASFDAPDELIFNLSSKADVVINGFGD